MHAHMSSPLFYPPPFPSPYSHPCRRQEDKGVISQLFTHPHLITPFFSNILQILLSSLFIFLFRRIKVEKIDNDSDVCVAFLGEGSGKEGLGDGLVREGWGGVGGGRGACV